MGMASQSETGSIDVNKIVAQVVPNATPAATGDKQDDATKTFTQEALNALMAERADRAKKSAVSEFLKELGFEKPEDLKELVTATKKRSDAEKSDLEKAQEKLAAVQTELAEKEQKRIRALIVNEVTFQASQLGFINPKEAVKLVDISTISVGDDDAVKGADEAVKALAEQSKHLLKQPEKKPALGATNPAGTPGVKSGIIHNMDILLGKTLDTSILATGGGAIVQSTEE